MSRESTVTFKNTGEVDHDEWRGNENTETQSLRIGAQIAILDLVS